MPGNSSLLCSAKPMVDVCIAWSSQQWSWEAEDVQSIPRIPTRRGDITGICDLIQQSSHFFFEAETSRNKTHTPVVNPKRKGYIPAYPWHDNEKCLSFQAITLKCDAGFHSKTSGPLQWTSNFGTFRAQHWWKTQWVFPKIVGFPPKSSIQK